MLGGCGAHIIAGNAPDRKLFSSQRCAGFSAGLGYSNHPFMEPGKVFKDCNAFIQPLWNLWLALGSQPVGVLNPAVGSGAGLGWSDEKLHPLIYQTADEKSLLIVSNLGQESASGSVELDFETLGIPAQATIEPLQVKGTHPVTVQGNRVVVQDMPPYFFAGLLIQASD